MEADKQADELELEEVEALKAAAAKQESEKGKGKEAWNGDNKKPPAKKGCLPRRKKADKPAEPAGSIPFTKLWQYSSNFNLFLVFVAVVFSLGAGVLQPLVVTVMGEQLDGFGENAFFFDLTPPQIATLLKANGQSISNEFQPTILKFVYFGIGMLVANYVSQSLWIYTSEVLCRDIRQRYVKAIMRQEIGWHDKAEDGSLTTRLALDTILIQDAMGDKLGAAVTSFATFVTGFVLAFVYGWRLALVMFACMPILLIVGVFIMMNIKKYTTLSQDVYAHAGSIVEQAIGGIRTVYAFSLQKRFADLYDARLVGAENSDAKRGVVFGLGAGGFFFALYSIYGLAFWYGSRQVIDGKLTGADVMIVFFSMLIGAMALIAIPTSLQSVGQGQAAAFKVFTVINRIPSIDAESEEGRRGGKIEGTIEFRNCDFHYPTRPDVPVLKSLSLKILPGQTVAFVGPSGSGKSTSVALVQRLYDTIAGEVLVDGHNIKEYNIRWLRENIGLVGQEPVLFNMTIRQNILMGATSPVSERKLVEVCQMANCHNFISMLPEGYETNVGEHGGMLSGGQKQRIAIARALIKDPQILLLDEATSALDTASERIVQKALDTASQNRTTIVIAHRLSTIRHADLIVVMDKGILVEQGTHESLHGMGGVYHSLVEKQRIATKNTEEKVEDVEDVELFNVPNQAAFIVKPTVADVKIDVGDGLLAMPDAEAMTIMANARREKEKKDLKQQKKKNERGYTMDVLRRMRPHWHLLAIGVVGACIAGATSPVFAYLLGKEIVQLIKPDTSNISPGPMAGANLYAFLFVVVGIASLIGFAMQLISFDKAGARLTRVLRNETFQSLMRQEIGFYDEEGHSLGVLTARLATDAADVTVMVSRAWGEVAQFIACVAVGLGLAFSSAANVTGIVLTLVPFAVFASYYRSMIIKGYEVETRKAYEEASETATEAIKSIRTVVALTRERWFVDRYTASLDQPHRLGVTKAFRDSIGFALNGAISQFTSALAFYAGTRLIEGGHVSFEDMFVTMMVALITSQSVGRAATFSTSLDKGKIGAMKTFEFLERQTAIDPDKDGYVPQEFDPAFQFKDIAFTYPARPDQPIFTGEFNVEGKPNTTLALVGPSGCGKSTTIGMLERWYDCKAGSVNVGGTNVKDYQLLRGLRSSIALVGQEPVLFDMTIRENIMWGSDRDDVPLEEIIEAANMANIHKFISSLPNGYNTRVGDKGSQLSGGQKQRIAIARALIRKPKLLLLDEATSALDSESEKIVQMAIDKASQGRTTVTIAHRLSTIQNADQIAVLRDGKVVELGRHFELLALNGLYADLVRQQDLGVN